MDTTRVRAFENVYANAIVKRYKNVEVGSQITKPGIIAIYAKKKEPTKKKKEELIKHFRFLWSDGFIDYNTFHEIHKSIKCPGNLGCIIGTVEVAYVKKNISELQFHGSKGMHLAPDEYYKEGHTHFWVLKNPVKFDNPIPFKWNSGGPWGKVDKSILEGVE